MHFTSYLAPLFLSLTFASPIAEKAAAANVIERTINPEVCIAACILACAFDPACIAVCTVVCTGTVELGKLVESAKLVDGVWTFN